MTAIVGVKLENRIVLAADDGSTVDDFVAKRASGLKIKRINGTKACYFALSGLSMLNNVVSEIPDLFEGHEDLNFKQMLKIVAPKLRDTFLKECPEIPKMDKQGCMDYKCTIVIATPTHLYRFNHYLELFEVDDLVLSGSGIFECGMEYARIKDKGMDIKDVAIKCIKNAIETARGFIYPISFVENDGRDVVIFSKEEVKDI